MARLGGLQCFRLKSGVQSGIDSKSIFILVYRCIQFRELV